MSIISIKRKKKCLNNINTLMGLEKHFYSHYKHTEDETMEVILQHTAVYRYLTNYDLKTVSIFFHLLVLTK